MVNKNQAMIKIESGVPIPKKKTGRRPKSEELPFADMKVGDSFLVPYPDGATEKKEQRIHQWVFGRVRAFESNNPSIDIVTRRVDGGVRVWRVR